jgi:hypothetical protein
VEAAAKAERAYPAAGCRRIAGAQPTKTLAEKLGFFCVKSLRCKVFVLGWLKLDDVTKQPLGECHRGGSLCHRIFLWWHRRFLKSGGNDAPSFRRYCWTM